MSVFEKMSAVVGNNKSFAIGQLFRSPSALKSSSSSANVLAALKILKDIGETLQNFPYLCTIAGISIQILEIREEISKNRALCRELIENVANRSRSLVEALRRVDSPESFRLEHLRQDLHAYATLLSEIHIALLNLTQNRLRGFIAVVNRDVVRRDLQEYSRRLDEFDRIFNFSRLTSLELGIGRVLAQVDKSDVTSPKRQDSCRLPPPTQMFTGREDVLEKLDSFFDVSSSSSKQQRVFVLYGMGGAGKTQIALKFLERASSRFSIVYYINANTVESLASSLQSIGPNAAPDADVSSTLRWLASQREDWLLLFDSVDMHDTDLRQFFPPCSHGNILITSRNSEMRRHAPKSYYHVGAMDPHEAVSLLFVSSMCESVEGNEEKAELLAAELGHLALAIVQAGSFISESPGLNLDNYLSLYKNNRIELLRHRSVQNSDDYEWTVYTTWDMSFQQLSRAAVTFLQLCAYWHHENIAKAIFQNALRGIDEFASEGLPEGWEDALQFLQLFRREDEGLWDDLSFQRVINELSSFSLIQSAHKDNYSIHPLVHSWTKDSHTSQSTKLCSGHILALSIRSKYDTDDYAFRKGILRHVTEWLSSDYFDVDFVISSRFALVFQERGWWKEAETLCALAVEKAIALYGDCHPQSFSSVVNLASVYRNQGRWDDAENLLLSVVEMQQFVLGKDHPDSLTTMKDLASVYHAQERWSDAERLGAFVLETQEKILGKVHPATLNTMASLAVIYSSQGRWETAKVFALSAVKLQTELTGEEHPDTLRTMANLASTYCSLGQWTEAEKLGSSVLEMRKRVLGEYHPNTLTSMSDLAVVYGKLGRWSEAQQLLALVISKQTDLLGEDHPDTMRSLSSLRLAQQRVQVKSMRSKIRRMSGLWKDGQRL